MLKANCHGYVTRFYSVAGLDEEEISNLLIAVEVKLRSAHGQTLKRSVMRTLNQLVSDDDSSFNSKSTVDDSDFEQSSDDDLSSDNNSQDRVKGSVDDTLRTLHGLHPPVTFMSLYCPPLAILPMEKNAVCDCVDFGFVTCVLAKWNDADAEINFDSLERNALESCDDPLRIPNNLLRKKWYKKVFSLLDNAEGDGRRELPKCACARIRQIYPSEDGNYMGFLTH